MTEVILRPSRDRLIAKSTDAESTTTAGLLLPEQAKGKTQVAVVVAVGSELADDHKVGDHIVHVAYGPDTFTKDGVDYLIMRADDVLATVE